MKKSVAFISLVLMAINLTARPNVAYAQDDQAQTTILELVECADQDLAFKILCNPRWPTRRNDGQLSLLIVPEGVDGQVNVTISRIAEQGLSFDDLTPSALSRVFGYGEDFTYAKTRIFWNKAVRIEARSGDAHTPYLLDYFFIQNKSLYRVSYNAQGFENYRKYLPLFAKMMRSFDFISPSADK